MSKIRVDRIIFYIIIIAIIIISGLVIAKYYNNLKLDKNNRDIPSNIENLIKNNNDSNFEINEEIKGYKVIGIINIPKINLKYPILETTNAEALNISITKFWGNKVNEIGNITLAGHNNLSGIMFGKIKKLKDGDLIELTDKQGVTIKYQVFKTYVIDPNDISCILPEDEKTREVTLITCTTGGKNRFIVKAREIK